MFSKSSFWSFTAPLIYQNPDLTPESVTTQATSDGTIMVKCREVKYFRYIQKILINHNIEFVSSKLAKEHTLKVVMKGILTDITTDELKSELEAHNFKIKIVKRFGSVNRPMPICLVIFSYDDYTKPINELTNIFF